jgi:hypothetical protein
MGSAVWGAEEPRGTEEQGRDQGAAVPATTVRGMNHELAGQVAGLRVGVQVQVRVRHGDPVADDKQVASGSGAITVGWARVVAVTTAITAGPRGRVLHVQEGVLRQGSDAVGLPGCLGQADDERGLSRGEGSFGER